MGGADGWGRWVGQVGVVGVRQVGMIKSGGRVCVHMHTVYAVNTTVIPLPVISLPRPTPEQPPWECTWLWTFHPMYSTVHTLGTLLELPMSGGLTLHTSCH